MTERGGRKLRQKEKERYWRSLYCIESITFFKFQFPLPITLLTAMYLCLNPTRYRRMWAEDNVILVTRTDMTSRCSYTALLTLSPRLCVLIVIS